MDIPNAPDELNFAPLLEHLDEEAKSLTGMDGADFYIESIRDLSRLFKEDRSKWEQLQVDYLVGALRDFFSENITLGKESTMQIDTPQDILQKLYEFLEDDSEVKERFKGYLLETNPEPAGVQLAELEAKIKLHTEYKGEEAKKLAKETADAVMRHSPETERTEALREFYNQLNRKQWRHWHS
jgi:hypothetical protein